MRGRIAAAGLVFAGVLAACGGDDDAPAGNPGAAGSSTGGASGKGGSSGAAGQGGSSKGGTGGSAGAATGGSAGKSGSAGSTQGGAAGTAGGGPGGSAGNAGATSTGGTAGSAGTAGTSSTGGTAGSAGKGAGGSTAGSAGAGTGGKAGNAGSSAGSSTGGSSAGTSGSGGSTAGNGGTSAGNGGTSAGNGGTNAGGNGGSGSGSHPGAGFPLCDNSLACGAFAIFGTSDLGTSHPCLGMYEKLPPLQMCACQPPGPIPTGCGDVCGSTSYCSQFPTKLPDKDTPCGKCLVNQDPTPGAKSCAVFVGNCQAANPAKPACNTCQAAYRLYNFGTNPEVCTNNGPPTSEALFKTLVECTQKECAAECAPGNFQCEGCATTKCKGAFDACAGG